MAKFVVSMGAYLLHQVKRLDNERCNALFSGGVLKQEIRGWMLLAKPTQKGLEPAGGTQDSCRRALRSLAGTRRASAI